MAGLGAGDVVAGGGVTVAFAAAAVAAGAVTAVALEETGGVAPGGGLTEERSVSYGGIGCRRFGGFVVGAVVDALETQVAVCAPPWGGVAAVAFVLAAATGTIGFGLLP